MMPPGRPGMGPGGAQQPLNIPGRPDAPGVKGPGQEIKIDPVKLPDNFKPPAVKPELMSLDLPLATADEIEKLRKESLQKYQNVLRAARTPPNDEDKDLIRKGIKYRLALMCQPKARFPTTMEETKDGKEGKEVKDLSKLHDELLRDLNMAATVPVNATPAAIKAFRQIVLQELINQAGPLLSTQNFYVRLHIAILLGELNISEEVPKFLLKQESYVPACEPLLQAISDPNQPEAVKILGVNSLTRIVKSGNPAVAIRTKIAEAIVAELKNKKSHPWYQMRLAGSLAVLDVDVDQARKPYVVDILKAILADDDRAWSVRAEAAKSLGRVTLPPGVNPPTVTRAVAEFTLKLAKAAQQSPQQKADDPKWKSEFIKVYLAFQPLDANDLTANRSSKAGLLSNAASAAKPAYDLMIPLIVAILRGQRLTVQQVQTLEAYVNPNAAPNAAVEPKVAPAKGGAVPTKGSDTTSPMTVGTGGSGPK